MYIDEQPVVPYKALNVIIAEINYGGRVTDNKDMRLIKALLEQYMNPEIMQGTYNFSPSGSYHSPIDLELDKVKTMIQELPMDDDPEVFGLHQNANITCQQNIIKHFMDTLQNVSPRSGGGKSGEESPDDIATKLAQQIEQQICPPFNYKLPENPDSLDIFKSQEIERYNVLIKTLKFTLHEIQKAIKGLVVMSQELEYMYYSFLNNKVPDNWQKVAYPSLKPLSSWIKDFIERAEFFNQWIEKGQMESYFVSALYFPQVIFLF